MSEIQRFDIPSKPTRIEMFRAFRTGISRKCWRLWKRKMTKTEPFPEGETNGKPTTR